MLRSLVGSEMCIRDRSSSGPNAPSTVMTKGFVTSGQVLQVQSLRPGLQQPRLHLPSLAKQHFSSPSLPCDPLPLQGTPVHLLGWHSPNPEHSLHSAATVVSGQFLLSSLLLAYYVIGAVDELIVQV
eukprot:TRINITY_DN8544_c0_g1_i3.p1 TRINITY_DN8544_c0_g1~~TRINITY_DN8544_c0_g1_i3.p1  ORF type:complete len:149 (+),score=29.69 TRINITY_DN8544_c0_g1_i3:69-449(+)